MSKSLGNIVVPWDVIDRTAPTRSAGTSSPPSSRGTATCSRSRRSASRCASSCSSSGTRTASYVLYANVNDVDRARRARDRARPLGALAPARRPPRSCASGSTTTTRRAPATRSPRSSTTSRTGTCAARARASGTATRPPSATLHTCLVTVAQAAGAVLPFVADEIYDNLDGTEPSVHLCDFPEAGRARRRARGRRWASCARPCGSGWPRAGRPSSSVRQPLRAAVVVAAGGEREAIERLERHRARASSTSRSCASSRRPTSSAPTRSSPTTARSGRASASTCRRWPPPSPRSTPRTSPTRCATARGVGINVDGHDHELGADDLHARDAAARGLPARARGLARGGARARARRRAASARASRARSCTRSRTRARPPACEVEDRIELDARRRRRAARRRARATRTT